MSEPIGVFDSGVGGLTVLRSLALGLPNENFVYLGDTARLPYGTKSPATIRAYSEQVMNYLVGIGVKALVIACNSASSQVTETEWKGIPVYNVIGPGAMAAMAATHTGRIGVLGTRATVDSGVYPKAIHSLNSVAQVFSQACPLFVPLAEEGLAQDPITDLAVKRYLEQILKNSIDTLILGCTHYPLLKDAISKFCGPNISLVESGRVLTDAIKNDISSGRLAPAHPGKKRGIKIMQTDLSPHSEALMLSILKGLEVASFEKIDLV